MKRKKHLLFIFQFEKLENIKFQQGNNSLYRNDEVLFQIYNLKNLKVVSDLYLQF